MGVVPFTLTTVLFFSSENTNNFTNPCGATTCSELSVVLLEGLLIEKTQLSSETNPGCQGCIGEYTAHVGRVFMRY